MILFFLHRLGARRRRREPTHIKARGLRRVISAIGQFRAELRYEAASFGSSVGGAAMLQFTWKVITALKVHELPKD